MLFSSMFICKQEHISYLVNIRAHNFKISKKKSRKTLKHRQPERIIKIDLSIPRVNVSCMFFSKY